MKKTIEQRFWEKVGPHDDPQACWLWQGAKAGKGYGRFYVVGHKMVYAHRFSYELLVGPIPEGHTLDHVKAHGCTHTLCVNPAHLEPVTVRVNVLRGNSLQAANAKKTHCIHGHPFDEENTHIGVGTHIGDRYCRTCDRLAHAKKRRQQRGHLKTSR